MICKKIFYKNFRNIEYAEIEPSPEVTVLNGANGQGKTNALEGIYFFAGGRSFRTAHENELIRFDSDVSEIELTFFDGNRDSKLSVRWVASRGKRFCKKNGVSLTRMSEMVGSFRAVLFCPEHLSLVKYGPSVRRQFIDIALSQTDILYLKSLQKYNGILAQRNALIKTSRDRCDYKIFTDTADIWSAQLAKEAAFISEKRHEYLKLLNEEASALLSDMTFGYEKAEFVYQQPRTEGDYYKLLTENTQRELKFGATLYGTHKDDILITLCGKEARSYASQGQQRSVALAMKLAEGEISRKKTGEFPVFLFDDILSELDAARRKYLLDGIAGRQVIITSCDKIETKAKIYQVNNGQIK